MVKKEVSQAALKPYLTQLIAFSFDDVMSEPLVRFFDGMEKLSGHCAEALVWANEIHIDSKYRESYKLPEMLRHERRHFDFLNREKGAGRLVRLKWILINNFWDTFDSYRLILKWGIHDLKNRG